MPIITVLLGTARTPGLSERVAAALQARTVHTLRKKPELIATAVQYVAPGDWVVAGRTLVQHGQASAFVDIRITDETNTKDEKARFIAEVFADLQALLGPLHDESYIHVHDVRAAAYGYGGHTQEARYHGAV